MAVIGFLRFAGFLNIAIWLGAVVSFTFALGPAFFSEEMKALFLHQTYYTGGAAQIVIKRYFVLLQVCGGVALLHLFLEKLYLGKRVERLSLLILALAVSLSLLGGIWLQPKLKNLRLRKYDTHSSIELRQSAGQSFKKWHGLSQVMNLVLLGSLLVYFTRVSKSSTPSRFSGSQKFIG
ncbi:MAG: DUF4149 domain-containing protein [Verrucomicrobiota bacterium]